MQSKIPLKRLIFIIGIAVVSTTAVFFLSFALLSQGYYKRPASLTVNQVVQNKQASSSLPIRLKIPRINVNAAVEYVGLTPQGAMAVPKGPANVAWYNLGPSPGENGSAVIAGHEGWKDGIPAVFDNLNKLQKGDKIYVQGERGTVTSFVVREIKIYAKNANASDVFGSSDGKAHLNLITCAGIWNSVSQSSSERLVIFTDKEL